MNRSFDFHGRHGRTLARRFSFYFLLQITLYPPTRFCQWFFERIRPIFLLCGKNSDREKSASRPEAAGGAMAIAHAPRFELTLTLSEGSQEIS